MSHDFTIYDKHTPDFIKNEPRQTKKEETNKNDLGIYMAYPAFVHAFEESFFPVSSIKIPLFNPIINKLKNVKLMIFPGGEDISPEIYREQNKYSSFNERRDEIEKAIFRDCWEYGVKMLGVCRGHQLINCLLGGNLYQDIYLQLKKSHGGGHRVFSQQRSDFVEHFNFTNSLHHQCIKNVPSISSLKITLVSEDGIIEAFEIKDKIVCTQFHPEFMETQDATKFFNIIKEWIK